MATRLCTFSGCRTLVANGSRCDQHQYAAVPKRQYEHHYHQGKNIYYTNRWKKARSLFLSSHPTCAICARYNIVTAATVVDHINELKDGADPFDYSNLQSLCHSCHNAKSADEARKRRKKASQNGFKSLSDF